MLLRAIAADPVDLVAVHLVRGRRLDGVIAERDQIKALALVGSRSGLWPDLWLLGLLWLRLRRVPLLILRRIRLLLRICLTLRILTLRILTLRIRLTLGVSVLRRIYWRRRSCVVTAVRVRIVTVGGVRISVTAIVRITVAIVGITKAKPEAPTSVVTTPESSIIPAAVAPHGTTAAEPTTNCTAAAEATASRPSAASTSPVSAAPLRHCANRTQQHQRANHQCR